MLNKYMQYTKKERLKNVSVKYRKIMLSWSHNICFLNHKNEY